MDLIIRENEVVFERSCRVKMEGEGSRAPYIQGRRGGRLSKGNECSDKIA